MDVKKPRKRSKAIDSKGEEPTLTHHEELWFEDGHLIVIASDDIAFRLHATFLSRHSAVLHGLIESAKEAGPTARCSTPPGPTLRLPERGADLALFFNTLYDGGKSSYFDRQTPYDWDRLRRLLPIAMKYEIDHMVAPGISRLRAQFPSTTLKAFDEAEENILVGLSLLSSEDKEYSIDEDHIGVIAFARSIDLLDILPVAFYRCACFQSAEKVDHLLDSSPYGSTTDDPVRLSDEDLRLLLNGKERLRGFNADAMHIIVKAATTDHPEGCTSKEECSVVLREWLCHVSLSGYLMENHPLVRFDILLNGAEGKTALCEACEDKLSHQFEKTRKATWAELGPVFGIDDWPRSEPEV